MSGNPSDGDGDIMSTAETSTLMETAVAQAEDQTETTIAVELTLSLKVTSERDNDAESQGVHVEQIELTASSPPSDAAAESTITSRDDGKEREVSFDPGSDSETEVTSHEEPQSERDAQESRGDSSPTVQAVAESSITFDDEDPSEGEGDGSEGGPDTDTTAPAVLDGGTSHPPSYQSTETAGAVSSITFHDLSYEVTQRKHCRKIPNKTILDSVSGEMRTGLNAIMGPTGSGKTTLLDLLADRKSKAGKSGKVLINGQKRPPAYKKMVGYVVQDDVVMGTLSVRENLQFSAALRLPGHMTKAQRKKRVERVIDILGLYRCADTKVGTEFFRGVSGGERKRTNIGMELIIEPQVLFLDEPTTGLDAHTAVSVVSLLKDLSVNDGRLVILSIHQPRYSIYKLFDSLSLLSQGAMVYHGTTSNALTYFDKLGFTCEEHENPPDFLLDTIIQYEKESQRKSQETVLYAAARLEETAAVCEGKGNVQLVESYRNSSEYRNLRKAIDPVLENVKEEKRKETVAGRVANKMLSQEVYATSFFWQLFILTMRSVKNILRSPTLSIFQLVFSAVLGFIIGIIYWQIDTDPNGFTDRIGALFFIVVNQSFGSLGAIQLFIQQKALFIHENASGYYRVSAFFISKIVTDLIPLRIVPSGVFAVIVYFMIGFQVEADRFFTFAVIVILVNICAVSVAFFVSAGVKNAEIANFVIILPFIFSLIFAGLLISLDSLPVWVSWLQHFSFMQYAIEAFAINEMRGLRFQGSCQVERVIDPEQEGCNITMPQFMSNCSSDCAFDGLAQLAQLGYGNTTDILWWDVFALVVYATLFMLLAYVVLRAIKKEK